MTIDLEALAKLAQETTGDGKARWTACDEHVECGPAVVARTFNGWRKPHDAAYIAAFDPIVGAALVRVALAARESLHLDAIAAHRLIRAALADLDR